MEVFINEKVLNLHEETTIFQLKELIKPESDVLILNGFTVSSDKVLKDGDKVSFIKKGEMPTKEELEYLLVSRHTPNVHEKIKNASVGIAGLGGLGSNVAVSLARMGIGKLLLIDFDVVEPSNLNRQQYFIEHIGMKKTEALKDIISHINPFVKVETRDLYIEPSNVVECFKHVDVIVEAFDNPKSKADFVNIVLKNLQKPIVAASGLAGALSSNTIKTKHIMKNLYLVGDLESEAKEGCGLMAPRAAIAANHQANMVVRIILGNCKV